MLETRLRFIDLATRPLAGKGAAEDLARGELMDRLAHSTPAGGDDSLETAIVRLEEKPSGAQPDDRCTASQRERLTALPFSFFRIRSAGRTRPTTDTLSWVRGKANLHPVSYLSPFRRMAPGYME